MHILNKIVAAHIAALALIACTESTIEVDGVKVTQAQCQRDFDKLEKSTARLLEIGQLAADLQYTNLKMLQAVGAEQSPALNDKPIPSVDMGPCGKEAQKAFEKFTFDFAYGVTFESEDLYKSLPQSDKGRAKRLVLDRVTKAREALSEERETLKKRARGI